MNQNVVIIYVVILILMLLASLTYIQTMVAKLFGQQQPTILTNVAFVLVLFSIFILIKYLLHKYGSVKEGFFFDVSSNHHCSGLYNGKPTSFVYDQVGSKNCKYDPNAPLGMINNNPKEAVGSSQYSPFGRNLKNNGKWESSDSDKWNSNNPREPSKLNNQQNVYEGWSKSERANYWEPVLPLGDDRVPYMDVNRRIN